MSSLEISSLHNLVRLIKNIKAKSISGLPNYANYGLFYNYNEISTGLMDNSIEVKIHLETGIFSYYNARTLESIKINTLNEDFELKIREFLTQKYPKVKMENISSLEAEELKRYKDYAVIPPRLLEIIRLNLEGKTSQVYLWGHNFDFDLVWYGENRTQVDIGVSPGDNSHRDPYLYLTPRPFNEGDLNETLPMGKWIFTPWKGILVDWSEIVDLGKNKAIDAILELIRIAKLRIKA